MKRSMSYNGMLVLVLLGVNAPFNAAAAPIGEIDALLKKVKSGWKVQSEEEVSRTERFVAASEKQEELLAKVRAEYAAEEKKSAALETAFQTNERTLTELEESLRQMMGNMGELFGVIRQVAGDTRSQLDVSLVGAQYPNRGEQLDSLVDSRKIPSVGALNQLWFSLMQEMTESGKVVRFKSPVTQPDGSAREREVIRVGVFNAVSEGKYLRWNPEVGKLTELARQPEARYLGTVADLEGSSSGTVRFALDPSRGSILSLLVQSPSLRERLRFGGTIGYLILLLGGLAVFGALGRMVYLSRVSLLVRRQKKSAVALKDNPLGRVMRVYEENPTLRTETLSLKLEEAVLREQGTLDKFLWAIKVVSVAAPLMGLLGTVTGMIRTFQAITLFGTGDPKLMAGGISEALVTTMLGLVVAIPLVLLHSWLRTTSRRLTDVLGEQSAGFVARRSEQSEEGAFGA